MEHLSAHRALQLATQAVPIIKHLTITDRTMSRKEFGQAIGLVRQAWKPQHSEQINTILAIVQAAFNRFDEDRLECHRVTQRDVNAGHRYQRRWVRTIV